jgi:hypothetical protein
MTSSVWIHYYLNIFSNTNMAKNNRRSRVRKTQQNNGILLYSLWSILHFDLTPSQRSNPHCVVYLLKRTQQDLGKKLIFSKEHLCLLSSPNSWTHQNKGLFLVAPRKELGTRIQGQTDMLEKHRTSLFYMYTMLSLSCRKPQHQSRGRGGVMPGPRPPGHGFPYWAQLSRPPSIAPCLLCNPFKATPLLGYGDVNVFHVGCVCVPSSLSIF